jgi:hypothetical protein
VYPLFTQSPNHSNTQTLGVLLLREAPVIPIGHCGPDDRAALCPFQFKTKRKQADFADKIRQEEIN